MLSDELVADELCQMLSARFGTALDLQRSCKLIAGKGLSSRYEFAKKADVIVFLLSGAFLNDSFCQVIHDGRMTHQRNGQIQVGIHVKAYGQEIREVWRGDRFFPRDGTPLSAINLPGTLFTLDSVLHEAVMEIASAIDEKYPSPPPISPEKFKIYKTALNNALESLNYEKQPVEFDLAISAANGLPTAFLLHGRLPSSGDRWLKSKLIGRLGVDNIIFIDIVLGVAERERDDTVNVFLKPMAEFFGPKKGVINNERIFSKVYDALLDNDFTYVIQISEASDLLMGSESKDFEQFIAEFWNPLNQVLKTGDGNHCGKLILFFVVEQSAEECSHFSPFCDGYDALNPLRLNVVDPLNEELVSKWIAQKAHHFSKLPKRPTQILEQTTRAEAISQLLLECDNGLPEKVLESICHQCGFQLSDILNININEAQN